MLGNEEKLCAKLLMKLIFSNFSWMASLFHLICLMRKVFP
ncbi:hypothetical protein SZ54_1880 [Rhizobium sp. UR51a]|nr:hypothetical protein SZ54_1880 [Rhizobium sp. UR51a]